MKEITDLLTNLPNVPLAYLFALVALGVIVLALNVVNLMFHVLKGANKNDR